MGGWVDIHIHVYAYAYRWGFEPLAISPQEWRPTEVLVECLFYFLPHPCSSAPQQPAPASPPLGKNMDAPPNARVAVWLARVAATQTLVKQLEETYCTLPPGEAREAKKVTLAEAKVT